MKAKFKIRECWFCNEPKTITEYFHTDTDIICIKCNKQIHPELEKQEIEQFRAFAKFKRSKELENKIWRMFNELKDNRVRVIREKLIAKGIEVPHSTVSNIISNKLKGL